MTYAHLPLRYALFATIATLANLVTQRWILWVSLSETSLVSAIICGTGVGLIVKYFLDKNFIFDVQDEDLSVRFKRFSGYTLTGALTTALFWFTESVFWYYFQTNQMREAGAVIGLSLGYFIKYRLDSIYIFNKVR
jgi:putative flippase GtrA